MSLRQAGTRRRNHRCQSQAIDIWWYQIWCLSMKCEQQRPTICLNVLEGVRSCRKRKLVTLSRFVRFSLDLSWIEKLDWFDNVPGRKNIQPILLLRVHFSRTEHAREGLKVLIVSLPQSEVLERSCVAKSIRDAWKEIRVPATPSPHDPYLEHSCAITDALKF